MRPLTGFTVCFVLSVAPVYAQPSDLAAKSNRGKALMAAGKFEEAILVYRDLVKALPNNPGPIMDLGLALHMAGHEQQAVTQFQTVLKLKPSHIPASLFLGAAYLGLKKPASAIEPLKTVVRAQPHNTDARLMLGEALLSVERFQLASEQFQRVSEVDRENPKAWNGLGLSYEGLANRNFEELERIAPGSAYWLVLVAEVRAKADQYDRSFVLYREALAKMPTMRGVHTAVAELYRKAGHPDWAAIEEDKERGSSSLDCNGARRSPAATAEATRRNATVAARENQHDGAKHLECEFWAGRYHDVVDSSRGVNTAEEYFWRARAYNELARQAFSHLAQLPPSAEVHELMAKIHFRQKNYQKSVKEWQEALKLSPGNSYYQQELAEALSAGGDYDGARPLLEELIKQSPDSGELNYWLGFTLLGLEKAGEAVPFLEKAVEGDPTILPAHRDLARAYLKAGQPEKALPHLKAALPLDEEGDLYYQLARVYRSIGNRELEKVMLGKFREIQSSAAVERKKLEQQVQLAPP